AERCGEVGYLFMAHLLVTGPPERLKALPSVSPPGTRRIELSTHHPARALEWLRSQPFCKSATIFGQTVHALLDEREGDEPLTDALRAAGFATAEPRPITPSLEDVFVTLTAIEERAAARRS